METIRITKQQLEAAFRQWESEHRAGATRTYEETQALTVEQVARESAAHFWNRLRDPVPA